MNSLQQLFILMLLILSLALTSHGISIYEDEFENDEKEEYEGGTYLSSDEVVDEDLIPLRGIGRFLAQKKSWVSALTTCNKYPKICRIKESQGRDCCNKKCVNRKTDKLNCGKCGRKCKYSEICCKGKCINPMSNKKHCGSCNNSCRQKKGKCMYGMCNYA